MSLRNWCNKSFHGRRRAVRKNRALRRVWFEALEPRQLLVNEIVAENLLPGSPASEWDIVGAGSANIEGFATDISVDQGQTVSFKVNTNSTDYRLDIYRMGYYGGLGARKVATVQPSAALPQVQPAPLTDSETGLVDAGNWLVSASWIVPDNATSGIYFAKLVREDGTAGANHIVFVVRDDDGNSDLLFQTSDATWQAYNNWGGNSLYEGSPAGRAYKVSYNRPFTTRGHPQYDNSWVFDSEYPMVRWLEANGYDISYTTNVDSDRLGSEILEHKAFLSVGHDEYWSEGLRNNLEAARDAGVSLAFFSGNEGFWKTRWETSIDASATPYRTLVSYKETTANAKIDPSTEWTGTWRDPRFSPPSNGGRPENALTGTMFMVNGIRADTITVPSEDGKMRFWRNTDIANLSPGQTASLANGALGYEWDVDVDNGFRPAGLIHLSTTTLDVTPQFLLNHGSQYGAGTATHSLTLYRAASGALVFGAGTIRWSWGLDGAHDNADSVATVPDIRMQQATVNLFADMNAQPGTLHEGLVPASASTDVVAPTSIITSPTSNSSFAAGSSITITGTATDLGGVVGGVEVSVDGGLTWHPATGRTNWSYNWVTDTAGPIAIKSRATDDSGNIEQPPAGTIVTVFYQPTSTTGLVAAYGLNAGSGTTVTDASSQGNSGIISGANWVSGLFGNALQFDGSDDWVTVADDSSLDLTAGMTLEAWVRPTAPSSSWTTVMMKERPTGSAYGLYGTDDADQPPAAFINSQIDYEATGDAQLPLDTWSFLTGTYDGSTLRLYVNGVLVSSQIVNGPITTSNGPLRIGGNAVWGEYFQGAIDEIRIYNRPLNLGEIRSDMSTAIGSSQPESITPTAAISSPTNGQNVSGVTTVSAQASDNLLVAGVQFLLNGASLGQQVVSAPYSLAWDTRTVPNGNYVLSVRATDAAGNATTSSGVTVNVNNASDVTPPTAKMMSPAAGVMVAGTIVPWVFATDDIALAGVQFKLNGVNIGAEDTVAPYRIAWNTMTLTDGDYSLTAVARDVAGNTTSTGVTLTVENYPPPSVVSRTPQAGAIGVAIDKTVTTTFSEPVQPSTISFALVDSSGTPVPGSVAYNPATNTATFTANNELDFSVTYTVNVSGALDLDGEIMAPVSWSFTTIGVIDHATIWDVTATPAVLSDTDNAPIELGVKVRVDVDGYITGLRFYKGAANTGTHVGHLWTSTGTLLATATFSDESASGWQQANFDVPVAVTANTTYVASYYAPNGGYSFTGGYFASVGADSGVLHALSSSAAGGNGVYSYGLGGGFPTSTFNANNYWVDIVYRNTLTDVTPATVVNRSPAINASGVSTTTTVTVVFSEPVEASTINLSLKDPAGNFVNANVAYDSQSNTATLSLVEALAPLTTFTATVSEAQDLVGNVMTPVSWSFTTTTMDITPPSVTSASPTPNSSGIGVLPAVRAVFSESVQPGTIVFAFVNSAGNPVPVIFGYNNSTNTATVHPSAELEFAEVYTATISGVRDLTGNLIAAPFSWSFTTAELIDDASLWESAETPSIVSNNDTAPIELGVKFRSVVDGYITGLRFYKGPGNTGTHVGSLWAGNEITMSGPCQGCSCGGSCMLRIAAGTRLATATFHDETASGWQEVNFAQPVAIVANATYVASYFAPNGRYSSDPGYFSTSFTNGPLRALATSEDGGNGVFHYGNAGGFPTTTFNANNYWVDVIFSNSSADETPPTLTSKTPPPNATGLPTDSVATATFDEPVQASTIAFVLLDSNGNTLPATVTYDSNSRTVTLAPHADLAPRTTYTATISGAQDIAGNTLAPVSWSFTVGNASLWSDETTPAVASDNDSDPVELGVKFQADVDGFITGLRFYKGSGNTGTHVGHLWNSSGALLGTATFTDETASGWQQVDFNLPVAITADTTYVASYYAPNGGYAFDSAYFNGPHISGPLRALSTGEAGGNGVYRYGTGGGFPTDTYNANNYWVDVVFNENLGDSVAPTAVNQSPEPDAADVPADSIVSAMFSEFVRSDTIVFELNDSEGSAVGASVSYDDTSRTITLDPDGTLLPQTTYTATLSGAEDAAGNVMSPMSWSFTTRGGVWTQTSVVDFDAGIHAGTETTDIDGGALRLAPALSDYFSGTTLDGAWSVVSWESQGGGPTEIAVAGGRLQFAGAELLSVASFTNQPLLGRIQFSATPHQHFGLATDLGSVGGNYWAIFSTGATSNRLFARVNVFGATQDVDIGPLPAGFHDYRIVPTTGAFQFYVDGQLQTTISGSFSLGTQAHVAISSYLGTASGALQVDQVVIESFATSGEFLSSVLDAASIATWGTASWTASLPAGTTLVVETRSGNTATPDATWSDWSVATNGGAVVSPAGRYLQYRVRLTTTSSATTAELFDIFLTWT